MKRYKFLLIAMLIGYIAFGQNEKIDNILKTKVDLTNKIILPTENVVSLKTVFSSPNIINPDEFNKIKSNVILKIELVFTTYRSEMSFNQIELNKKRLLSLNKISPELYSNELIEWKLTGQTGCASTKDGEDFFHGFVITYRPAPTLKNRMKEIAFMDEILGEKKSVVKHNATKIESSKTFVDVREMPKFKGGETELFKYLSKSTKYPKSAQKTGVKGIVFVSFIINELGEITGEYLIKGIESSCDAEALRVVKEMPNWIPGKRDGKAISTSYTIPIKFGMLDKLKETDIAYYVGDGTESIVSVPYVTEVAAKYEGISTIRTYVTDSTIYKIFERNKDWNEMLVVTDFTGSMSPFTSQLLLWHKLNMQKNKDKIKYFTFFNDGDQKPDKSKQIGKTGGIYNVVANDFDNVMNLAKKTIQAGGGGDCPENNIEAVLVAIEKCPECKEVIMIADNYATPRDLELLSKVTKPIKIIMCGTNGGINTAYLEIVRKNKGSLHTINNDIMNLMELNEGEEILIENRLYKINNGKFQYVYKI